MLQTVKTRSLFTNSLNMLKSYYIQMFAQFRAIRGRLYESKRCLFSLSILTVLWGRLTKAAYENMTDYE